MPNAALTFNALWNTSSDNSTLTYKQVATTGQKWLRVFTRLVLSSGSSIDVAANLTYVTTWPAAPDFPTNAFVRNFILRQALTIDFSRFASSDLVNYPTLTFNATCPQ